MFLTAPGRSVDFLLSQLFRRNVRMNRRLRKLLLPLILTYGARVQCQDIDQLLTQYKAAAAVDRTAQFSNPGQYVHFLLQSQAMHDAETSRIDKQTEASSASGLSTSAVTKGSVPWLFAVAVEHGALTQSVE